MIVLGIILLILGLLVDSLSILVTIGAILIVVGLGIFQRLSASVEREVEAKDKKRG